MRVGILCPATGITHAPNLFSRAAVFEAAVERVAIIVPGSASVKSFKANQRTCEIVRDLLALLVAPGMVAHIASSALLLSFWSSLRNGLGSKNSPVIKPCIKKCACWSVQPSSSCITCLDDIFPVIGSTVVSQTSAEVGAIKAALIASSFCIALMRLINLAQWLCL